MVRRKARHPLTLGDIAVNKASNNAAAVIADALAEVGEGIESILDRQLALPDDQRAPLYAAMRYSALDGGKRLRPLLVMASARLFAVDPVCALRAGAAVEAIHCYSLIHDDLPAMDDDDMRRGKPTLHRAFDEATAILAGDALQTLAFEMLADPTTHADPFVRLELITELARAAGSAGMIGGQMMDLAAETTTYDLATITRLQQLKTGALIAWSVEAGAILGRVPPDGRAHVRGFARDVGLAFQIVDDLIDVEGDADIAGKAVGKDEAAGKETFVSLMGVDRAREQAQLLFEQAVAHIVNYGPEADLLRAIAQYIVERNR